MEAREKTKAMIEVAQLYCGYRDEVVLKDVSFSVAAEEICVIVGRSGCGKSTLLRNMIGLEDPLQGDVIYEGKSFLRAGSKERTAILRTIGVLYQGGALWSTMTIGENVALPLHEYTVLSRKEIDEIVNLNLAFVGLGERVDHFPAQLSGGMRKRAALARAIALNPKIVFFDEPSAGLDPVTARSLDELILSLRESMGTTIVVVSHELESIFTIADNIIMLDPDEKTVIASGCPRELLESADLRVKAFFSAGKHFSPKVGLAGERFVRSDPTVTTQPEKRPGNT